MGPVEGEIAPVLTKFVSPLPSSIKRIEQNPQFGEPLYIEEFNILVIGNKLYRNEGTVENPSFPANLLGQSIGVIQFVGQEGNPRIFINQNMPSGSSFARDLGENLSMVDKVLLPRKYDSYFNQEDELAVSAPTITEKEKNVLDELEGELGATDEGEVATNLRQELINEQANKNVEQELQEERIQAELLREGVGPKFEISAKIREDLDIPFDMDVLKQRVDQLATFINSDKNSKELLYKIVRRNKKYDKYFEGKRSITTALKDELGPILAIEIYQDKFPFSEIIGNEEKTLNFYKSAFDAIVKQKKPAQSGQGKRRNYYY